MKLVKSLLLGSAVGLTAVAGAQAADLPFRKAAPVDYVRVCDWVGLAGYFYIPGTDTCLKVGGLARLEYGFVEPTTYFIPTASAAGGIAGTRVGGRLRNASGFYARGNVEVDTRTQTAYGLLRAFARIQGARSSGNYSAPFAGLVSNSSGGVNSDAVTLDKGYITFAGLTAGRQQSMFDYYADTYNYDGIANSDSSTQMLAYTATFGGGFSATISIEDGTIRRSRIGTLVGGANAYVTPVAYTGERYPDAVGVLRYDQAWGSAQVAAAFHQVTTAGANLANSVQTSSEAGFAVMGGINVKLPMIAAGDELWLQGAYQEGAFQYQDEAGQLNNGYYGLIVGGFVHQTADAVAVGLANGGYRLQLGSGFSVTGAFHHYFTPQFHDVVYGSYEEIGYGATVRNTPWFFGGVGDASEYRVGNQFIFTPVHNLDIGVDVMYSKINQDLAGSAVNPLATKAAFRAAFPGVATDPDSFTVRLQLNRSF